MSAPRDAAPRPKVGDRVRVLWDQFSGREGLVINLRTFDGALYVQIAIVGEGAFWLAGRQIEILPATPPRTPAEVLAEVPKPDLLRAAAEELARTEFGNGDGLLKRDTAVSLLKGVAHRLEAAAQPAPEPTLVEAVQAYIDASTNNRGDAVLRQKPARDAFAAMCAALAREAREGK